MDAEIVYDNLIRLCYWRGCASAPARMNAREFAARMADPGYITIAADRAEDDPRGAARLIVAQFSFGYPFDNTSKIAGVLARIIGANASDARTAVELVLVSANPARTTVQSAIKLLRAGNPHVRVEHYAFDSFLIVVPEHILVPAHHIVARAEVEKMCSTLHMVPTNFPRLRASGTAPDPMAIWLGLRPHMVVRIDRPSETAGIEVAYRLCD